MADDPAAPVQDPPADPGAQTDPPADPPAPPDLAARLTWDTASQGDLPDDLPAITNEDIQSYATQRSQEAVEEIHARNRAEIEARKAASQVAAQAQTDIEYYDSVRTLQNGTEEQRTEAQTLLSTSANEDRFISGGAAKRNQSTQVANGQALQALMTQMSGELKAAGIANVDDFLPPLNDTVESRIAWAKLQPELGKHDGKGGIASYLMEVGGRAALAKAEADGIIAAAREEGALDARTAAGRQGAPPMTNTNPPAGGNTEKFSDQAWVNTQMANDTGWGQKLSSDGKKSNVARVREALTASR